MRIWVYATTLLVSAFLLFSVQPMIARLVLPFWGGGSGVWSVCLLFFQGALLFGYLYAHLLAQNLGVRAGALVHGAFVLVAITFLVFGEMPGAAANSALLPSAQLLWQLARHLAIPCILLSSTAPLLQHWFAQERGTSAYRLYAVSNVGSLVGLLCYPLVVEPLLGLEVQTALWTWGYALLAILSLASAALATPHAVAAEPTPPTPVATRALWLALSAAGVMLLLSVTTEITANLVPMPLLWVVPLALYLLTFIWCFGNERAYSRRRWLGLFSITLLPTLWLPAIESLVGVWPSVVLSCAALFSGCMICHGELAKSKPATSKLSLYYVFLAAGGVLGSLVINVLAPIIFARNWDLATSLFFVLALVGVGTIVSPTTRAAPWLGPNNAPRANVSLGAIALWAIGLGAFAFIGTLPLRAQRGTIAAERSFYGALSVVDHISAGQPRRSLSHGRIRHGAQHLGDKAQQPTLYFSADSGIGRILQHAAYAGPRRIGVVGLGAGTLASYGTPDDSFRFYELDPLVVSFAKRYFSFLSSSQATINIVVGDGRLALQQELSDSGSNGFDLLIIDAFNADAVPTHLLTREAFQLYWQHLGSKGTLALNITNAFLDLAPVVQAHANELGAQTRIVIAKPSALSLSGSTWILVTNNSTLLEDPSFRTDALPKPATRVWTDDYSNILSALK
tara:strand:+ start:85569 stop:87608 length:2040 start_codon:yes stop_codon:yes gene_type:complete